MTCQEVNEFLADYLEGTLPWRQRLSFKVHLVLCRRCRQYLASYVETIRLTHSGAQSTADDVPDELVRAILAMRRNAAPTAETGPEDGGRSAG